MRYPRRTFIEFGAAGVTGALLGCGKKAGEADRSSAGDGAAAVDGVDDGAPDLIVLGGTIVTFAPFESRVEAVAVRDGTIVKLGARETIDKLAGARTEVIDLAGGVAVPGLIDAHGHLSSLGRDLEEVDLRGARSVTDVVQRLRSHEHRRGWIEGRGWDQNLWAEQHMPTHQPLTDAFPDRPVWLRRVDGHAGWGNAALLDAAGITAETRAPEGGEILLDEGGNPTGVLVDAAMDLVPVPKPAREDYRRWILAGQEHVIARGLTGVHDMGVGPDEDAVYRELAAASGDERLKIRVHGYANEEWFSAELLGKRKPDVPAPADPYALAGVKFYADGALGSRGAAMLAPYSDRPGHKGLLRHGHKTLERMCADAMGAGWQVATHAIGDAGNRAVLRAYDRAFQKHRTKDHRFRVEHCQIMDTADIGTFSRLGVIASMQPTHATSDMGWVPARVGKARLAGAYAWRRFLGAGVHLCFGSDFPVELADVTHGLYAATTRQDADGKPEGGWLPDQKLTTLEALRAFSIEAAYAAKRDDHLGQLRTGHQADLTCFADDVLGVSGPQLRSAKILATIVRGKLLYGA